MDRIDFSRLNKSSLFRLQIGFLFGQQQIEHPGVVIQEILRDLVVLGFLIGDLADAALAEFVNPGLRIREEDGRMRRDNKLAVMIDQSMQKREDGQLALWRERRLRLVEQVDAVALQPICEQREEGFAMRLRVERYSAVAVLNAAFVNFGCDIVKTFRAQEPAVARVRAAGEREMPVQFRGRLQIV